MLQTGGPYKGVWGYPAFWGGDGGYVYMTTNRGPLSAFKLGVSGSGKPALSRDRHDPSNFGYTSGSPMVTSNGTNAGLRARLGRLQQGPGRRGGQLRAYDAVPNKGKMSCATRPRSGRRPSSPCPPPTTAGCTSRTGPARSTASAGRPPIALAGTPTDFGMVAVKESVTKQVRVTAKRTVSSPKIKTGAPFTVGKVKLPVTLEGRRDADGPGDLPPDEPGVGLGRPRVRHHDGHLRVRPARHRDQGRAAPDPSTLDFGEVPSGGVVTLDATITNSGSTRTTITGATGAEGPVQHRRAAQDGHPAGARRLGVGADRLRADGGRHVQGRPGGQVVHRRRHPARHRDLGQGGRAADHQPRDAAVRPGAGGEVGDEDLRRQNTGNLLLTLTKAAPPTAPFQVPDPVRRASRSSPATSSTSPSRSAPTKVGAFDGTYSITGNDGKGAHLVTVHGTAVTEPAAHAITGLGKCVDVRKQDEERDRRAALHLQPDRGPGLGARRRHLPRAWASAST